MENFALAMASFAIVYWVLFLGVAVLLIVAKWRLYEKAGEPGWAAIVPYYESFVLYKISWGNGWYFLLTQVPGFIAGILYLSVFTRELFYAAQHFSNGYYGNPSYVFSLFAESMGILALIGVLGLGAFVVQIITCIKLARAFGQGGGFACGLIFLYPVFVCILAFSKEFLYRGVDGQNPPPAAPGSAGYGGQAAWQSPYYQPPAWQQPEAQQPPVEEAKYCPACGARLRKDDVFCFRCGKEQ
jgi:hypothetical protein